MARDRSGLFRADGMPLDTVREMLSETLPDGTETIPNLTDLFDHLEAASRQGTTLAGAETAASRQRGKQAVEMVEQYRRDVAERMGVAPASISDEPLAYAWEKDKKTPDQAEVDRWVESLGKTRDEITATDLMAGVRKGYPLAMIKESVTRTLEPENVPMDVGDGVTFSIGRQRTKGKAAMEQVIADKVDVRDAMHRKGVGAVSFYYGEPGDPARDYKGGWGVSHIIARRTAEGADGSTIARRMADTIAMGKIGKPYGPPGGERVNITLENDVAVLSKYKDGERETWLLTGWEQEKTADASGRGDGLSGATLAGPTRTRSGKGAAAFPDPNIPPHAEASQTGSGLPPILAAKGARVVEAAGRDQKLAAAVGETLGLSVVFYEQEGGGIINGMADTDGRTVYINAAGTRPVMWILAHETVHQLRRTNPEAYQKLRWIAKQHMTKNAPEYLRRVRDNYREEGIEKDAKALEEELIADYAGDKMLDPDFVKMLARRNPTLARRVIATLRSIVNRVQKALKGEDAAGFLRDARAMQNALADALGAMGKEYRVAEPEGAGGVTLAKGELRDTKVSVPDGVFQDLGIPKGNVFADYTALYDKHPDHFPGGPGEVKAHVEHVLSDPNLVLPGMTENHRLLVRRNGSDKAVAIEIRLRGGKYRVESAYTLDRGQLEAKVKKEAQRGGRVIRRSGEFPELESHLQVLSGLARPESAGRPDENIPLLASNGKPSNLTRGRWEQVRTPEFKAWFGDWETAPANASKVVDENGEPLVVYHGTNADFSEFDFGRAGETTGEIGDASSSALQESARIGAWFNSAPTGRGPERYGAGYVADMPVHLRIANPFTYHNLAELERAVGEYGDSGVALAESLKRGGYDGVVVERDEEFGGTSYIAFSPNQIKSATGNRGTFDPDNPDIALSMAAEQSGWWKGKDAKSVKGAGRNLFRETTRHAVRTDRGKLEKLREDVEAMRGERRNTDLKRRILTREERRARGELVAYLKENAPRMVRGNWALRAGRLLATNRLVRFCST